MNFSDLCNFTPMQWQATELSHKHRYFLYGGRRGVLKSYWLRWYCLRRLLKWGAEGHDSVEVMLGCEDYPSLVDRQVKKIRKEFPEWLGSVKTTRDRGFGFHVRPEYGNGFIAFRNLDDPTKYKSAEYAGVAIDELTRNPEYVSETVPGRGKVDTDIRLFDVLRGSLRWPGLRDTFFVAASNPDGVGQVWVRSLFVEKSLPDSLEPERGQFGYLKGIVEDKNLLPPEYWQMLDTLPEKLKAAWVDADWYVDFGGKIYQRHWFEIVKACPAKFIKLVRYWDKAGTKDGGKRSAGVLIGRTSEGIFYAVDVVKGQWASGEREKIIEQTAEMDRQRWGSRVYVWHEQEPGSGGKESAEATTRRLAGFNVKADKVTGSKDTRQYPLAAQAEAGNVMLVAGSWNQSFIDELCDLPGGYYRDQADAAAGAFNKLTGSGVGISI